MRLHHATWYLAAVAAASAPAVAGAQGFGLNEIGTCTIARAAATTARPCEDGSAIFWNPAATTLLKGVTVSAGVTGIQVSGDFTHDLTLQREKSDIPISVPPSFFANWTTRAMGRTAALGLGVYVPYGLTSQWEQNFSGRFSAQKAALATIYVQPNFAIDLVPGWSIGAGPIWGHSTVELRQSADLSGVVAQPATATTPAVTFGQLGIPAGTEFARVRLKGSSNAWGFTAGVHGMFSEHVHFGARYLSKLTFNYDGADAVFTQVNTGLMLPQGNPFYTGGAAGPLDPVLTQVAFTGTSAPLTNQKGSTTIPHPEQASVGLAYDGYEGTVLEADYGWIGWSSFEQLPVNFSGGAPDRIIYEDYKDSWAARASAQHTFDNKWVSRLGFSYVKTPAPEQTVTPLLPDMDRFNLGLGLGIPLLNRYAVDLSYLSVMTNGRRGRIVERTDRAQTAAELNTGAYSLNANVFSLSLRAQF